MNKNIIIGVVAVVLVAVGFYWFVQNRNGMNSALPYGANNAPSSSPATAPATSPSPTASSAPAQAPVPAIHNVVIRNFAFNQPSITVKKGDAVIWTNEDSMGHTVTGNNGGPASQTIGPNGNYRYTFNAVGTFGYHCAIHPSMTGTVTVIQ